MKINGFTLLEMLLVL
ncbi:prepilin-type N-terminal cleavage/methylation domain-containing protein, partial [Listeria monocytogenes]|nr:prepilin-type N-terminal cleavage/methylation domain-containing protein [Listeria monocytogenes]